MSKTWQFGSVELSAEEIRRDYQLAVLSRQASLLGRKEVLGGRAKFGIFGDGKEVAQVAMARAFRKGDWRAGYYRDQTFMFAVGACDVTQFFAQLYADTDLTREPSSAGRQMNSHFSTRFLRDDGSWRCQRDLFNSSADMSPTGGQMARLLGLAYASKIYRHDAKIDRDALFTGGGSEVAFGTIGDASTSEGIFWEVLNAAGVLQVPMLMSVWDDGFGISVPKKYQTTKESISELCAGLQRGAKPGFEVVRVAGWDYPALMKTYQKLSDLCRREHVPCLVHVDQLTQPQGHSTSGSHERYKTDSRMQFEKDFDCLSRMRQWMIEEKIINSSDADEIEAKAATNVLQARDQAWNHMMKPMLEERDTLLDIYARLGETIFDPGVIELAATQLKHIPTIGRRHIASSARRTLASLRAESVDTVSALATFVREYQRTNAEIYDRFQFPKKSALNIEAVPAEYSSSPEKLDGSQVIRKSFDFHLGQDSRIFIVGEDVGHLGGVNTEFEGLQEKYGSLRVTDTGIREASILGQGIGAAMRGLRPIVDIQYLDYVLYCLQGMSDDLATLHYRSAGGQIAPVIVRTKGHRLEGIWHTGSPMGTILNAIRGMHFCVPRNMVQAAGMYNTLLLGDDPAFVCEVLNGYRLKETVPSNLHQFRVALGVPEILRQGDDLSIVTYGACVRIVEEAAVLLAASNISVEIIDVQTLSPFDRVNLIGESLRKTNALMIVDEDVPGGAGAYMLQHILARNFEFLDAEPVVISAKEHRGAYASDGDYYSKPNAEDIFDAAFMMMNERMPYAFGSHDLDSVR